MLRVSWFQYRFVKNLERIRYIVIIFLILTPVKFKSPLAKDKCCLLSFFLVSLFSLLTSPFPESYSFWILLLGVDLNCFRIRNICAKVSLLGPFENLFLFYLFTYLFLYHIHLLIKQCSGPALVSILIRIRLFISIRIQVAKPMVHTDPDPDRAYEGTKAFLKSRKPG